ncbi:hypothetical protein Mapa_007703 [Marchantia paleacea]|nr:hypothetical protein Mapa_007703 [Marchantia paleacea]
MEGSVKEKPQREKNMRHVHKRITRISKQRLVRKCNLVMIYDSQLIDEHKEICCLPATPTSE